METVKATKSHLGNAVDIDKCSDSNVLTKERQGNITERKSNVGVPSGSYSQKRLSFVVNRQPTQSMWIYFSYHITHSSIQTV